MAQEGSVPRPNLACGTRGECSYHAWLRGRPFPRPQKIVSVRTATAQSLTHPACVSPARKEAT
jgi:hypothetical protein